MDLLPVAPLYKFTGTTEYLFITLYLKATKHNYFQKLVKLSKGVIFHHKNSLLKNELAYLNNK